MALYECTQCGYVTETISPGRCPGCGSPASETCCPISSGGEIGPGDGKESAVQRRYAGYFTVFPETGETRGVGLGGDSPIVAIARVHDDPLHACVEKWYRGLTERAKARYDKEVLGFMKSLQRPAVGSLAAGTESVLFAKVLEVVARSLGTRKRKVRCCTCTYYLGSTDCGIEHIRERAVDSNSSGPADTAVGCPFHIAQTDRDYLLRRLRFLMDGPDA